MEKDPSTRAIPLIGIWKLISFEARREGEEPSFPFGIDAKGLLIYTDVGRLSVQMMRANRPNFVSGDQLKGTVEEVSQCFTGCISYFGRYEFDANGGFVIHHIESSLFPNWEGTQKRFIEFSGSQMSLKTSPVMWNGKMGIGAMVWERVG
jgi:Lipocalin-like domain